MILALALALAAICGVRNIQLNERFRTSHQRDAAAKWGVASCAAWVVIIIGVVVHA